MAKKKRRPPKKSPKRPARKTPKRLSRAKPKPNAMPRLPDPRSLEGMMKALLGGPGGESAERTPLQQAQELMYTAFDESNPKRQVKLAEQALQLSEDCADAYLVLADHSKSRKESLELIEKAVAAGERALGPEYFRDSVGDFWLLLETRPYMRARERLADVLWTLGRREEAAGHLQEMLRLNPGDNQGIRYTLASWLLNLDRDDDLERLLEQYPEEGSATWAYTRTLLAFRRGGDTPEARKLLKEARKTNKHIPAYLLGNEPIPLDQPDYYSPGAESEAIIYTAAAVSAWKSSPGAITWLRDATKRPRKKRSKVPSARGPTPLEKQRLSRLPREFDVWQMGFRQFGHWVEADGERVRPWMVMVSSRSNDLILGNALVEEPPTSDLLWDVLAAAMAKPPMSEPHRPVELQVRRDERWDALRPHLEEIGVECITTDELDQLDFAFEDLTRHLTRDDPPGLLDMPGITPERVAGFYGAAAEFYRRAPWRSLGYEEAIRIKADKFESGPWYAVVMGQSGLTLGVALYEDLDLLRRMWAGKLSEEENARQTVAVTVTFDPDNDVPPTELDAAQKYGWEVAGPEAYPSIFRKERGLSLRPPLAWELELLEGCLRAIPDFVAQHRPGDTTTHRVTVPVVTGELELDMSWVEDA
jgi:tetratricopeptide (TPR) repeat protein